MAPIGKHVEWVPNDMGNVLHITVNCMCFTADIVCVVKKPSIHQGV